MNMRNDTTSSAANPQYTMGFVETLAGGSGDIPPWGDYSDIPFPTSEEDYENSYYEPEVNSGLSPEDKASYIFTILSQKQNEFEALLGSDKMLALAEYFFFHYLDIDLDTLGEEYEE